MHARRLARIFLTLASFVGGCGPSAAASVMVLIDAQPSTRGAATSLHVRVFGHDGAVRLDDVREVSADTLWPLRLPLVPEGNDASRTWIVEATLLDVDGAPLAIARSRGRYTTGAAREVAICLFDECAATPCGTTESDCTDAASSCLTCRAAECGDATAVLEAPGASPRCPPPGCVALGVRETACSDGLDDDCDGRIDCRDPDCGCDGGTCVTMGDESTLGACHNRVDDDCDGLVDCDDDACTLEEGPENCDDGIDDDCDGETDCFDAGCCQALVCAERTCGSGGHRCCGGVCVDTWGDRDNCGACGVSCANDRGCSRVPLRGGGSSMGAACRCRVGAGECPPRFCEAFGDAAFCVCSGDGNCPGESICVMQDPTHASFCNIPRD